jgi:cytochrome P450
MANKGALAPSAGHKTIFHELVESDLPAREKDFTRLVEEGQLVLTAGAMTTSYHLKSTVYFILADKNIHRKLKEDLTKAIPNPQDLPAAHELERLPYLSAVVKEGFRINDGASTRLGRIRWTKICSSRGTQSPGAP